MLHFSRGQFKYNVPNVMIDCDKATTVTSTLKQSTDYSSNQTNIHSKGNALTRAATIRRLTTWRFTERLNRLTCERTQTCYVNVRAKMSMIRYKLGIVHDTVNPPT